MTIKSTFIREHSRVKVVFGTNNVQSKFVPNMAVFFTRKFKGLNIKYSHRDPPKSGHFLTRNDVT